MYLVIKSKINSSDLVLRKVLDAHHNNGLRTFLQNLVDESDVFGGEEDDLLRALPEPGPLRAVEAPGRHGVLLRGGASAAGYLGDAAGARVPAWMPLVYSLASRRS